MNNIVHATEFDKEEILDLYRSMIGKEFCSWNEHYPSMETIEYDLSRDSLFIMKNDKGRIIAAITIDLDDEVEKLECWSKDLYPWAEVSRIAVKDSEQGKGIAKALITFCEEELRRRGKKSIHLLVNKENKKALASYSHLNFTTVGECHMFNQPFWCYEKAL